VAWCEAMISLHEDVWFRCGKRPTELHHRLTRARGGLLLDEAGESYHLMHLCHQHHKDAHDQGSAFENGLLIDGYVTTGPDGRPQYTGSDPYLSEKYRPMDVRVVREELRRSHPGADL
jgi:hypothetical protein